MAEWLTPPPHEKRASCFEQELKNLARQRAFLGTTDNRRFLQVEWHRLHDLDEIGEISAWAKRAKAIKLLKLLSRIAGDHADQLSAQFAKIEVWLTASERGLIDKLLPAITGMVLSCGGTPGQHSLEYQPLEEGEGIPGYWYSKGTHIFES